MSITHMPLVFVKVLRVENAHLCSANSEMPPSMLLSLGSYSWIPNTCRQCVGRPETFHWL